MLDENITQYMRENGKKGGNAKTDRQKEAHREALKKARDKRWPKKPQ